MQEDRRLILCRIWMRRRITTKNIQFQQTALLKLDLIDYWVAAIKTKWFDVDANDHVPNKNIYRQD